MQFRVQASACVLVKKQPKGCTLNCLFVIIVSSNNKSNWCDKIYAFPDSKNEYTDQVFAAVLLVFLDSPYRFDKTAAKHWFALVNPV